VRHDPEFAAHDDLHMLCKSAAAGARFAALPQLLHRPATLPSTLDADASAALAARARALVLACLLPKSTGEALHQITQLYALYWPPTLDFAQDLLHALAHACFKPAAPPEQQWVEHETLTRALRHEALRLLRIFFDAGLADRDWLERQFMVPEVAQFLAPASNELPVRVFRHAQDAQAASLASPAPLQGEAR
jgi:hypothetical protein